MEELSDKDLRRQRFNRRKKGKKQRNRKQKEKSLQQFREDTIDYGAYVEEESCY